MVTPVELLQDQLRELKGQISSGDVRVEDCVARLRSTMESVAERRATAKGLEDAIKKLGGTV